MKTILLTALLSLLCIVTIAQPQLSFQTIASGLTQPVDVVEVNDGSNRLFVVERTGKIKILNGTTVLATPFIDVQSIITTSNSEQGLLSLAFHPDYATNGYFYIYYDNTSGAITIARYTRSTSNTADPSSGVVMLTIPKPFPNHNGGDLNFGPDGFLYFGTGDGGSGGDPNNNAQTGSSLLGKFLRIDVDNPNPPYYRIPATNPYVGSTTVRPEIIGIGLRNPWRFSFDKQTGDLWLADVGQDAWEEVNFVPAANRLDRNFGWRCFEGTHVYNNSCTAAANNVFPVFEYGHNSSTGGYSITGGYVYRGTEFPSLQGFYICADYVSGNGWLINSNGTGGWNTTLQKGWATNISSFSETANGTLYATSLTGNLYKIAAANPLPLQLVSFTGQYKNALVELQWQVQHEEAGDVYLIETRSNSNSLFNEISKTEVLSNKVRNNYSFRVEQPGPLAFYRLKTIAKDGQIHYSPIVTIHKDSQQKLKAYVSGNNLKISLPPSTTFVEILDGTGKSLKRLSIRGTSLVDIPLASMSKGLLTVSALVEGEWQVAQVIY